MRRYSALNTTFSSHGTGLLVVGRISPQYQHGNDWTFASTTYDAVYGGDPSLIPYSLFQTDEALVPNGYSKIEVPVGALPEDWFQFTGSDPTCQDYPSGTYCGEMPFSLTGDDNPSEFNALSDLDLDAIVPYAGSDPAAKVLKWEAQRYLYQKLFANPTLVNWNTDVTAFFNSAQNNLIGKFRALETGIRRLFFPPDHLSEEFETLVHALDSLAYEMIEIEEQLPTASETEKAALLAQQATLTAQINPLTDSLHVLESEIAAWRATRIVQLQALNASISPVEDFQDYEKTVYGIHLATAAQEITEFSQSQKDIVDSISAMCPSTAGTGTYWARGLRRIYDPAYRWGVDECEELSERAGEPQIQGNKPGSSRLFPNPANDILNIQLEEPLKEEGSIAIFDVNGKLAMLAKLIVSQKELKLSIAHLLPGVYFCEVKDGQKLIHSGKISVAR